MKNNFQYIGLAKLCGWFGITRQAYYQNNWEGISTSIEEELILKQVKEIRKNHRRIGTRKLYEMLPTIYAGTSDKNGQRCII